MGRSDQTAKIQGMFVRRQQIAEIGMRHPSLDGSGSSCAGASRRNDAEGENPGRNRSPARREIVATLRAVTKLGGAQPGYAAERRQGNC